MKREMKFSDASYVFSALLLSLVGTPSCVSPNAGAADTPTEQFEPVPSSEANRFVIESTASYHAPPPPPVPPSPPQEIVTETEMERRLITAVAGTGDVQISVAWSNKHDLDLHLKTACGSTVDYREKESCGFLLDVDRNVSDLTKTPVENIRSTATVRSGHYRVYLDFYALKGGVLDKLRGNPAEYVVRTIIRGVPTFFRGKIGSRETGARKRLITEFDID